MEKYILDSQYKKYLERAGIQVDKALKDSRLPEDLFIQKKPTLDEVDYYRPSADYPNWQLNHY